MRNADKKSTIYFLTNSFKHILYYWLKFIKNYIYIFKLIIECVRKNLLKNDVLQYY